MDRPSHYVANPSLGRWIVNQRVLFRCGKLPEERIKRLNELDFVWNSQDASWLKHWQELYDHMRMYGKVPTEKDNPRVFSWMVRQKRQMRKLAEGEKSTITEWRKKKLDWIGLF